MKKSKKSGKVSNKLPWGLFRRKTLSREDWRIDQNKLLIVQVYPHSNLMVKKNSLNTTLITHIPYHAETGEADEPRDYIKTVRDRMEETLKAIRDNPRLLSPTFRVIREDGGGAIIIDENTNTMYYVNTLTYREIVRPLVDRYLGNLNEGGIRFLEGMALLGLVTIQTEPLKCRY